GQCQMRYVPPNISTGGPQWNEWDSLLYAPGHDASYETNYWINQNGTHQYQDGVGTRPSAYQANELGALASDFIAGASQPFFVDVTPSAPHLDLGATVVDDCKYSQQFGTCPWPDLPTIR